MIAEPGFVDLALGLLVGLSALPYAATALPFLPFFLFVGM